LNMKKEVTRQEVQVWLEDYFRDRPELGLRKAILAMILEPAHLFEPKKPRYPEKSFVLLAIWILGLLSVFVYFNLLS
jgi:hypothetical protein